MTNNKKQSSSDLSGTDWLGPMFLPFKVNPDKLNSQDPAAHDVKKSDEKVLKKPDNIIVISFS